ncbi:MAG: hypothetical protein ABWW65_05830 [Thermoprotei archaeon]
MQWTAKLGVTIILVLLIIAVIAPLLVFFIELYSYGEKFLVVEVEDISVSKATNESVVVFRITYSGTIPLRDFKLQVNNLSINIGDVVKGSRLIRVHVELEELTPLLKNSHSATIISFKVAGLYEIKEHVRGGIRG